ncbi:hypothetical protein TorRG33x02_075390, partial [Trema orientale]
MGQTSLSTKNTRKLILLFKMPQMFVPLRTRHSQLDNINGFLSLYIRYLMHSFSKVAVECCSEFSFLSMNIPCQTTKNSSETPKEIKESQTPFRMLLSNLIIVPIFFNKLTNVEPLDGSQWLWRHRFPISSFFSQSGFQI